MSVGGLGWVDQWRMYGRPQEARARVMGAMRRQIKRAPGLVYCSGRTKSYWCSIQEYTHALWVLDESERSWVRRAVWAVSSSEILCVVGVGRHCHCGGESAGERRLCYLDRMEARFNDPQASVGKHAFSHWGCSEECCKGHQRANTEGVPFKSNDGSEKSIASFSVIRAIAKTGSDSPEFTGVG